MKVLEINSVPYGSTATISYNIAKLARQNGIDCMVAYGYSYHPQIPESEFIKIGGYCSKSIHLLLSRITGLHGVYSYFATKKFMNKVQDFRPDIIHIHNLHGWFINIPQLVNYVNKHNIKVVWTLHDCWAFTGHCPYYDLIDCKKWKNECFDCPIHKQYPQTDIDRSRKMFNLKKRWFGSINNLTIVTPSEWLKDQVSESFLKEKTCKVINNGIDLNRFNPNQKLGCSEEKTKFRIICVSFNWDKRKGLDAIIKLSELLDDNYEITMVGTDDNIDKILPRKIRSIHRTQNVEELVELYCQSDVFVNTTREENFPTVNIEAIACGLPVITFKTGGSPEIVDATSGIVVPKNDVHALADAVRSMRNNPLSRKDCRRRAELLYNKDDRFMDYINLYKQIYAE